MKITLSLIVCLFVFTGCFSTATICPTYPKPSKHILSKIKSLNDVETDLWMVKQYKLNKQLGVCNE